MFRSFGLRDRVVGIVAKERMIPTRTVRTDSDDGFTSQDSLGLDADWVSAR